MENSIDDNSQYQISKRKNDKKKMIGLGLTIFFAVILLVFGGFRVFIGSDGDNQALQEKDQQIAELQEQIAELKTEAGRDISTNESYLTISQWGVKIPLDESISNIQYTIQALESNASGAEIKAGPTDHYGMIYRVPDLSTRLSFGTLEESFNSEDIKQIGNYYYAFRPAEVNGDFSGPLASGIKAFREAFKSLQAN